MQGKIKQPKRGDVMQSRLTILLACLFTSLLISSVSYGANNAVSIGSGGIVFPDNSVQQKAAVLPICSSGEVYVNSSGSMLCGRISLIPNGIATCVGSACSVSSCMQGYDNCDSDPTNGCESNLMAGEPYCGACNTGCTGSGDPCLKNSCINGACTLTFRPGGTSCYDVGTCNGSGVCTGLCIYAGANGICNSIAVGDDIQVNGFPNPNRACIAPGPNGICESVVIGDDIQQ